METMNKNEFTDDDLTRLFEKDSKNISADSGIGKRLEHLFMIKSASYRTFQNSFAGFFSWIFSWSNVPVKAALVSIVLFISVMNHQTGNHQFVAPGCDTMIKSDPFKIDSANMLPFNADTCLSENS